jgi:N-acetylneuraminate synthase
MDNEKETLILQRRAIRAVRDLVAGTKLKEGDLICLRPCPLDGLPPYKMDQVMGQNLKNDLKSGDIVTLKDIG